MQRRSTSFECLVTRPSCKSSADGLQEAGSAALGDDELLITRTFDAPASVLFASWSEPEHMRRWMGPANLTCPEVEIDFRAGGA